MKHSPKKIYRFIFYFLISIIYSCSSISELYIVKKNNKWGYIDKHGKLVVAAIYDYCCIQRQEDTCCSRIIQPNGLGIVKLNDKYGAIDIHGRMKISAQYDFLDQYHNSLIIAKSEGKYAVLSKNGDTIFPFIFDNQFISCNNTVGYGQIDGKFYLLNFKNQTKIATDFDKIAYFTEGLAAVRKDGKYGFINELGEIVIGLKYQEVWPFNKGLAAVKVNYEWGFIDTTSSYVIKPQFDDTQGFDISNGEIAIVVKNRKYGVIDRKGNYLIQPKYEYLYLEDANVLNVSIFENNQIKRGLINLKEKWLYISDNQLFEYYNGYLMLEKNNKVGLVKMKSNKTILPAIFDEIAFRNKGLTMVVIRDAKSGIEHFAYANRKGKIVWQEDGFMYNCKVN